MSEEIPTLKEHIAIVAKDTARNSKRTFRLQRDMAVVKSDLSEIKTIIRKYDFNGHTEDVRNLLEAAPEILKVVSVGHELIEEAQRRRNLKGFIATVRRWIAWDNGVKVLVGLIAGAVIATIFHTVAPTNVTVSPNVTYPSNSVPSSTAPRTVPNQTTVNSFGTSTQPSTKPTLTTTPSTSTTTIVTPSPTANPVTNPIPPLSLPSSILKIN